MVIDSDHGCCETLRRNMREGAREAGDWDIREQNVSDFGFTEFEDTDLLSGGPPCQPFSQGGSLSGRADPRDMLPQFIRAVRECQPKSFILENVKGLLHCSFFNYFNYIIHQLRFPDALRKKTERWTEHRARLERLYTSGAGHGLKYNVIWQVLDAADFGAAQRRKRVFAVGVRSDLAIEYSFPIRTHSREALWADQWATGNYWERHCISRRRRPDAPRTALQKLLSLASEITSMSWQTVRDAIGDLPNVGVGRTSRKVLNHFLNPGARVYDGHTGSNMDAPAKAIKAGHHGVSGGENVLCLDDGTVRYFSVRECARLQTFPDHWEFEGSWCNSMRQIGNAVPVKLGAVVAMPLADALRSKLQRAGPSQDGQ